MLKARKNTVITETFEMEYFTFGEGKRQMIILPGISVRSIMFSAEAVAGQYASVTDRYTVTVFDRKKNIEPGYDVIAMADDTAAAMRKLGLKNTYIYGASQGGMMALALAIRHPDLVEKIVVAGAQPRDNAVSRANMDRWYALCEAGDPVALNRDAFRIIYSEEYLERFADAFAALEKLGTPEEIRRFAVLVDACRTFDVYDSLDSIRCPVFAVGATGDRALSDLGTREIADKLGCESYIYEGYSHAVYDEAPDFIARQQAFFG